MATMKPQAPAAAAPMMSMSQEAEEGAMDGMDGGYTICVRVSADGSLSVGTERETAEEAAEEYANFTPAEDIKAALTKALEIYKSDGQADAAEADFAAGLASRGGMQG